MWRPFLIQIIINMDFSASQPKEAIELFFSCRSLKNMDYGSVSDSIVHILIQGSGGWVKIGETEVKKDSLNPDFAKSLIMDYYFEKVQNLRFEVFDQDPEKLEFIGECTTTLSKIAGARNQTFLGELKNNKGHKTGHI